MEKNENKMIEILTEMYSLSEDIYKKNKEKNRGKIAPISAIVYNPNNFEIKYKEKNKSNSNKKGHAEVLILNSIEENKDEENCKNYHLMITCPPCSECINKIMKKKIEFKKIEWLTSLGKEEELDNLGDKKYGEFNNKEKNNSFKANGSVEKWKLISAFRWIEYKKEKNSKDLKII